ncbi:unnamed protein product [Protopolystoma xenopodis]|uniref:Uncharacterized protein n=1 Tax=Protopolystoma xenopodis TaxID=117903 RepID=A0A448XNN7_9PLAT|nr:unnamed protein product [Protopolystoma xenopodis]
MPAHSDAGPTVSAIYRHRLLSPAASSAVNAPIAFSSEFDEDAVTLGQQIALASAFAYSRQPVASPSRRAQLHRDSEPTALSQSRSADVTDAVDATFVESTSWLRGSVDAPTHEAWLKPTSNWLPLDDTSTFVPMPTPTPTPTSTSTFVGRSPQLRVHASLPNAYCVETEAGRRAPLALDSTPPTATWYGGFGPGAPAGLSSFGCNHNHIHNHNHNHNHKLNLNHNRHVLGSADAAGGLGGQYDSEEDSVGSLSRSHPFWYHRRPVKLAAGADWSPDTVIQSKWKYLVRGLFFRSK